MTRPVSVIVALVGVCLGLILALHGVGPDHVAFASAVDSGSSSSSSSQKSPSPSASAPAGPAGGGACSLLTAAEISHDLGGTATVASVDVSKTSEADCTWNVSGSRVLGANGTVEVDVNHNADNGQGFRDFKKTQIAAGDSQAVPGIGQDAYVTSTSNALNLAVGNQEVGLQVLGFDALGSDPEVREHLLTLAAVIAAKLH